MLVARRQQGKGQSAIALLAEVPAHQGRQESYGALRGYAFGLFLQHPIHLTISYISVTEKDIGKGDFQPRDTKARPQKLPVFKILIISEL